MALNEVGRRGRGRRRWVRRAVLLAVPAALLAAGCTVDLGTLGGDHGMAEDVNDAGLAVGTDLTSDEVPHAFRRAPGAAMIDLNGDAVSSHAYAVNEAGVAVGEADLGDGSVAVLWQADGTLVDLGFGRASKATDINDDGTVVGVAGRARLAAHGGGRGHDPAAGGLRALLQAAEGVNEGGDVVGWSIGIWGPGTRAVLWPAPDYQPVVLPQPDGDVVAEAVADDGAIVGNVSSSPGSRALLWQDSTHPPVELGGAAVTHAADVNEAGQVIGTIQVETPERTVGRAVRWDPGAAEPVQLGGLGGGFSTGEAINAAGDGAGSAGTRDTTPGVFPAQHAVLFPHDT